VSPPAQPGRTSAVVPTLGTSPHLGRCLAALRAAGGAGLEIVVVAQGTAALAPAGRAALDACRPLADVWVDSAANLGFTGGTNAGIAASRGEWVATVNDDAVVEPGWLAALRDALAADPRAAAAQGTNLALADPATLDGLGLAWNRRWQAVQLGHGTPAADSRVLPGGPPAEVFGVSATAALYRRRALDEVALPQRGTARAGSGSAPAVFDPCLGSWYEDADLACRLRAAGWRALSVPAARALHAGSATGGRRRLHRFALLHGNRHLVAARLLGRAYLAALPRMAWRDLADLARAAGRGDPDAAAGIVAGGLRAARHLPAYLRLGPPAVPRSELRRLAAPPTGRT